MFVVYPSIFSTSDGLLHYLLYSNGFIYRYYLSNLVVKTS